MSNKGYGDRGDPRKHASATTGIEGGGDEQGQGAPALQALPPKPGTHTRRPADPGEERWVKGRKPPPRQPERGKECFLAHHLAVSPHRARSPCWKGSGLGQLAAFRSRRTRRRLERSTQLPAPGALPHLRLPPRAVLRLTPVGSPPPSPSSFFPPFPLPPPSISPSSLWIRAAVNSGCAAGLEAEDALARRLRILISFLTSVLLEMFSCSPDSLITLSAPGFI